MSDFLNEQKQNLRQSTNDKSLDGHMAFHKTYHTEDLKITCKYCIRYEITSEWLKMIEKTSYQNYDRRF